MEIVKTAFMGKSEVSVLYKKSLPITKEYIERMNAEMIRLYGSPLVSLRQVEKEQACKVCGCNHDSLTACRDEIVLYNNNPEAIAYHKETKRAELAEVNRKWNIDAKNFGIELRYTLG